jgi:enterochelin esterase-like enzyme
MISIIGKNKVQFIYKGNAENVFLAGDINSWRRERMLQINENEWLIEKELPCNTRSDYKFVVDGEEVIDADNPLKSEGGFGFNSELIMPCFHYPTAVNFHRNIPHGEIKKFTINDSIYFRYKRDMYLYLPHRPVNNMPVIVFQDGLEYILFGSAKNTLDYLIYKKEIPKVAAIFIDIRKENRIKEYSSHSKYSEFLSKLILPYIEKKSGMKFSEKYAAGVSLGGFIAIDALVKYPDIFSGAISQSGALLFPEDMDFTPLKGKLLYIDAGRFETHMDISMDTFYTNKFFEKKFKKAGANVIFKKWNDGHSWGNWKAHLPVALKSLFRR